MKIQLGKYEFEMKDEKMSKVYECLYEHGFLFLEGPDEEDHPWGGDITVNILNQKCEYIGNLLIALGFKRTIKLSGKQTIYKYEFDGYNFSHRSIDELINQWCEREEERMQEGERDINCLYMNYSYNIKDFMLVTDEDEK
jgi:hypothetical protein